MKTHALIAFLLFPVILIISCEKDWESESNPVPPAPVSNYGQLKVGNYWIYERYNLDTSGIATSLNVYDSCFIEKDTMINGKNYYKMVRPNPFMISQYDIYYLRDSLHYIIQDNGNILFSYNDYTTVFDSYHIIVLTNDTVCQVVRKMEDINMSVTVPAGTYVTMNSKLTFYYNTNWTQNGNPRYRSMRFANHVGIVSETFPFFASVPFYTERWLVSYYVQ